MCCTIIFWAQLSKIQNKYNTTLTIWQSKRYKHIW